MFQVHFTFFLLQLRNERVGKSRRESKEKKEEVEIRDKVNSKRRDREREEERMKIRTKIHRERNLEVGE